MLRFPHYPIIMQHFRAVELISRVALQPMPQTSQQIPVGKTTAGWYMFLKNSIQFRFNNLRNDSHIFCDVKATAGSQTAGTSIFE